MCGKERELNALAAYADPAGLPATATHRFARLLNLDESEGLDEIAFAHRVSDGLPVSSVTALGELVGRARIEGRVASEATLHRCRKSGRALSRSHSERVYGVARVLDAVGTAFHGDVQRIRDFLLRPHPLLGGESPLDLALASAPGADAVLNLVWRAEAGVAV
ncbi:MAG: DUF2384 domain-containing protein [Gemmatimonadetes bacterium]|nr:DUF2384 domain-containing protein [Gemmatimonadota bacterium]MYC90673.1 DUF2384 domain-containing protein [Gemmatimonadota bacterium]MYJ18211.1 DUF2384 domain-containing protein [Gemmatimonadota bacterium]